MVTTKALALTVSQWVCCVCLAAQYATSLRAAILCLGEPATAFDNHKVYVKALLGGGPRATCDYESYDAQIRAAVVIWMVLVVVCACVCSAIAIGKLFRSARADRIYAVELPFRKCVWRWRVEQKTPARFF